MKIINLFRLRVNEKTVLTIKADTIYSNERVSVNPGETYLIECESRQHWTDSFFPSSPRGFFNPLALLVGMRLKGTRCFCLCGAYNENEEHLFEIGLSCKTTVPPDQTSLSFFANDAINYYHNNKGQIQIVVSRLE